MKNFSTPLRAGTSRLPVAEQGWLFDFLVGTWMRAHAGLSLHAALEASLQAAPSLRMLMIKEKWQDWLRAYSGGSTALDVFTWPSHMARSRVAASLLSSLLRSGSPAVETLADYISQIDDDRQASFEERIGALPVRLSLGFCAFFAPAVFLVLLGALWPSLQNLPI